MCVCVCVCVFCVVVLSSTGHLIPLPLLGIPPQIYYEAVARLYAHVEGLLGDVVGAMTDGDSVKV